MRRRSDPEAQRARRAGADREQVLEAAARSLGGAPKTSKALIARLLFLGYPDAHVRAAVERLEQIGLVDDERLARSLLASRDRSRQRGDRALLQELRRRGVDDALAARLLSERSAMESSEGGDGAELRAARSAAARMKRRGDDPRTEAHRMAQALVRRGFPSDIAWQVARERLAAEPQETAEAGFDPEGGEG